MFRHPVISATEHDPLEIRRFLGSAEKSLGQSAICDHRRGPLPGTGWTARLIASTPYAWEKRGRHGLPTLIQWVKRDRPAVYNSSPLHINRRD
jgi:hypothetical protein